jgi:HpcH/HpaI aldolase/citrate lyase family
VSALVLSPPLPGIGDRILGPQAVREFWFHAAVTAAGMRSLKHLLALADELCERGVGLGADLFDYLGQRGGETVCALLIETRAAIDNIEEICQVEGIGCLTIAPFDLSTELGVSGQLNAPELVQAVTYAERCHPGIGYPAGRCRLDTGTDAPAGEGLPPALASL